jgi:DNA-binding Lrp family transcriptional regulator
VDAFVYLRIRPGKVEDVVTQIQASKGVRNAVTVVGDWDVLAAVHGPDLGGIATDVLRFIHRIDGVERTMTAPVVPADVMGLAGGGLGATLPMQQVRDACFVRIKTAPDATTQIFEALAEMEDVSGVALTGGQDDILAEVGRPWDEGARVVLERVQQIRGIVSTNTLVAVPLLPADDDDRDAFSAWN